MLPISELRGGIPLGLALGLEPAVVITVAFAVNCLIFFPIYFALELFYERFFIRFRTCRKVIERVHKKGSPYVERYGVLGLAVLVGIPVPFTGAWTGSIVAWLLGLGWKKSFLAISLGVLAAALIVSAISLGLLNGLSLVY